MGKLALCLNPGNRDRCNQNLAQTYGAHGAAFKQINYIIYIKVWQNIYTNSTQRLAYFFTKVVVEIRCFR